MTGVVTGFAVIGIVVLIGYAVGRSGVIGERGQFVLGRTAFYVLTPCLLLTVVAEADLHVLVSPVLLAVAIAGVITVLCYTIVARLLWRRPIGEVVIGALSASYVNANNMGLPVAVYILGNPAVVAPVLIYQTMIASPLALTLLELYGGVRSRVRWRLLLQPFVNPLIVTSMVGLAISAFQISVPAIVLEPFRLIGVAAVPTVLLSFGMSLHGRRLFAESRARREVALASTLKLAAMPVIAAGLGALVMHLDAAQLYVAVALAALPTAQNVYNYAQRYGNGEPVARDAVLITTVGALPVLLLVSALLAP